ncbi:MAG: DUF1287 domain-containing protein [Actinomycetota bacterium]|nr:DUF1287 domain-containing protein [Actinomycetota bacterium]
MTLNFVDKKTEEAEKKISQQQTEELITGEPEPDELEQNAVDTETSMDQVNISEVQKEIVLKSLDMLEEGRTYQYELYPDTGYPPDDVAISTDVIALVMRDCGYDLMELIYDDISQHPDAYPMDIVDRDEPIKYIDFRHVFFQETFFSRNALELSTEFNPEEKSNNIHWQPGDLVFFQFDPDTPHQDMGGIISPNTNDQGVPLVIMTSQELGKVSEVDVLLEYDILSHYRYPYPEEYLD